MATKNSNQQFGAMAKWLHWLVFVLIVGMITLGLTFGEMPDGDEKLQLMRLHASFGLILLAIMTLRLVWRWTNPLPDELPSLPAWRNLAARWVHRALYALIFCQIAAGMLTIATRARAIPFFGLLDINLGLGDNDTAHEIFEEIHKAGWIIIAVLVTLHTLAALHHHFVLKNQTLRRMTTGI
jgi:cytochrome b561